MAKQPLKARDTLIIAVLLCLLITSVYNIIIISQSLSWPYSVHYGEALVSTMTFSDLYKSFSTYPYRVSLYPPLTYIVVELFNRISSPGQPYFSEGLAVLLALAMSVVLIYLITRKITKGGRLLPALASLLFLSSSLIFQWGISHEPIMFELALDLLAIYLILDYKDNGMPIYSGAVMAIAMLFRQTSIFVFIAILAYLVLIKKRRDAALFAATYLVIVVPTFLLINILTNGRFLLSIVILPAITPLSTNQTMWLSLNFLLESWILFIIPFVIYWVYKNKGSVISITLILTALSLLTINKIGADTYYFIPFYALACIGSAAGIEKALLGKAPVKKVVMAAQIIAICAIIPVGLYYYSYYRNYDTGISTFPYQISIVNQTNVGLMLKNVTGPILVSSPAVAVAANKTVVFEPGMFWVMQKGGMWNDSRIVSDIESKKFGAIVFPTSDNDDLFGWYPQIEEAAQTYYSLNKTVYGWNIYYPDK